MTGRQWYYAQLRWAVTVEDKQGLRALEEAVHIFLSENQETAFQQALEFGRQGESVHREGRRNVETRLAEVVRLDCLGRNQTQFEVRLRLLLATWFGPLRQFNLAHPRNVEG